MNKSGSLKINASNNYLEVDKGDENSSPKISFCENN